MASLPVGTLLPAKMAKSLPGGTGYILVHPKFSKIAAMTWSILWLALTMMLLAASAASGNEPGGIAALAVGVPCVFLGIRAFQHSMRTLEMTDSGLTKRNGRTSMTIPWKEVTLVDTTGISNRLVIHGSQGNRITVDSGFDGKATLVEYLRTHIPSHCSPTLLNYFPVDRGV